MTLQFAPVWKTPADLPLNEAPLIEGDAFSYQLQVEDCAITPVETSPNTLVELGFPASNIYSVRVNDIVLPANRIIRDGTSIILNLSEMGLGASAFVEFFRASSLSFVPLYGTIPPGIVLGPTGLVNGILEYLGPSEPTNYSFTVRVSNGSRIADRNFSVIAEPLVRPAYWVSNSLPTEQDGGSYSFFNFGTLRLMENVALTLDVSDDDLGVPLVVGKPLGFDGDFYKGLPAGLELIDNRIQGTIRLTVNPGRYLFRMGFENQQSNEIIGEFIIQSALAPQDDSAAFEWITPAGSIGELDETRVCDLSVKTNIEDALYFLSPASLPLPPGIQINPTNGDLEGFAPPVVRDTVFRFSVRASKAGQHIDREFSITIRNRFDEAIQDIRLRIPQADQNGMIAAYQEIISPTDIFRPTDSNFGIDRSPYIYVIKGISGSILEALVPPDDSIDDQGFHGQMTLFLGRHRLATVRNSVGEPIYEVIYRDIIDPNELAGGFRFYTDVPIEKKVLYPQSNLNDPKYIYPRSLRNARYDLVNKLGIPTTDSSKSRLLGPLGGEIMPRWMISRDDPKYVPAVVVAYLKPGRGAAYLTTMDTSPRLPSIGRSFAVDRYYIYEERRAASTTFDEDLTTFDGNGFTATQATFDG